MIQASNKVIKINEARRGMVLLPFKGATFGVRPEQWDWTQALYSEWWQHIVIGVTDEYVTLARPYAYAREHFDTHTPLLGVEVYNVPRTSDTPYMLQRENFST